MAELSTTSGDSSAAKMQLEASLVCVRALLTSGRDADAIALAKQVLAALIGWSLSRVCVIYYTLGAGQDVMFNL